MGIKNISYCLGYQQVNAAGTTAAFSLTIPTTKVVMPNVVRLQAETQALRYRDDGTDPTTSIGMLIPANTYIDYDGDLNKIRLINATAGAILNASYYV